MLFFVVSPTLKNKAEGKKIANKFSQHKSENRNWNPGQTKVASKNRKNNINYSCYTTRKYLIIFI
jgi:hypothetical protein